MMMMMMMMIIIILLTANELSLGGSSPYTGTDKTNNNKYKYKFVIPNDWR
jgi:hypothetical protein